jgi:hypothetical protein
MTPVLIFMVGFPFYEKLVSVAQPQVEVLATPSGLLFFNREQSVYREALP